jgi:hypothetical protein
MTSRRGYFAEKLEYAIGAPGLARASPCRHQPTILDGSNRHRPEMTALGSLPDRNSLQHLQMIEREADERGPMRVPSS